VLTSSAALTGCKFIESLSEFSFPEAVVGAVRVPILTSET